MKFFRFASISVALLVMAGLLVSQAPVGAITTTDAPFISQPQYSPGQEVVMERGRAHRVFYEGNGVFRAEFVGSPEFTKSGDVWVDYVFSDEGDYYQIQHPWSSARFYDYYTEVWNEEFTEVKIYDDRWVVEYLNKQGKWNDTGFWNVIRSFDVVADGIKMYRTGSTDIGQRIEEYYFRDGSPCKITIYQTCDADQAIRFVWKPTGIVATTEHEIIDEIGDYPDKAQGLNYYDAEGNFVQTIRWFDTLATCNATPVVDTHAQGRKAEVTFGDFVVAANETAILDPETFYPDADPETSSVDGHVGWFNSTGVSWITIVTNDGTEFDDARASSAGFYVYADNTPNTWGRIRRGIYLFDTDSLPDTCTITGVVLSLFGQGKDDTGLSYDPELNIYSSNPASNDELIAGDYDEVGTEALSSVITYADWSVVAYNDFTLIDVNTDDFATNEDGTYINKEGVTKLGSTDAKYDTANRLDAGAADPNWVSTKSQYMYCYHADEGVGFKPRLVVTYLSEPTVVTNPATSVEETTMTLSGNITATGGENCDYRGFEWDTDSGTPYTSNWTEAGSFGVGQFTHGISSLTEGELYYYRAMAHNSAGWGYGSENFSLTKPDEPSPFTATAGENMTSLAWTMGAGADNITVRGQIDSYPADKDSGTLIYQGTGTSVDHTSLTPGDHWYYRGWSWCTEGGLEQWSDLYGQDDAIPYTTPTCTTANATDVTSSSATLGGNITSTGYINCTERGFDWGLSSGNYSDNWTEVGSFGTGVFTHIQGGFSDNTTYYCRAKTQNPAGWAYGNEVSFTTLVAPPYPGTPTSFTLTDLGGVTIGASWSAGTGNTTSFLLLVDRDGYPASANSSIYELAYSGNLSSANLTGFDLDDNVFYFSLWGYNDNGYSLNYATASIGAEFDWLSLGFITEADMETLAETLGNFLLIAVVAGISILAYWHRDRLLYVLAGLALMSYAALQWGENIYIGLILIVLGLYTFAKAAWGARRA